VIWLAVSFLVFGLGSLACLLTRGRPAASRVLGPAVTVAGAAAGMVACLQGLAGAHLSATLPWSMPLGSLCAGMDPLSAVFAMPILLISALAAVYGSSYLRHSESRRNTALSWFFFNILAGSMLLVVTAHNAILFLLGWELMSLASFFLVIFDHDSSSARRAGWTYLIATHIGTAFILVLFACLGRPSGSLDFAAFSAAGLSPRTAGIAFALALIGFGTKAGFMPMHVWLPDAHPAAPSHVSAVMSGVMIKTGIYGLLRSLTFLGAPAPWWGWTLIVIGAVSGILGVVFALAQMDIKRLLAYSSVENMGIIALALGLGLLGTCAGSTAIAFLGFAGGLLHMLNHSVFKSLLFLGAGSVLHATETRNFEHLGGLLKRMPATGLTFLVGAVAICGIPPLNGFVSEFLIYLASFRVLSNVPTLPFSVIAAALTTATALALIGGLAVVCFSKAFGMAFLGEPRSSHAEAATESDRPMRMPMLILAMLTAVIGFSGPYVLELLKPAVSQLMMGTQVDTAFAADSLRKIVRIATLGLLLTALLAFVRSRLLAGRKRGVTGTWDCGYLAPAPRMQYTASSYVDPVVRIFSMFLRTRRSIKPPEGVFPAASSFSTETPDVYRDRVYRPAFASFENLLSRFRWIQHGRVNLYVLYIVIALVALLIWKMRS
jgi:hydrogenase-4 component B